MSANPYREPGEQAPEPRPNVPAPTDYQSLIDIHEQALWRAVYAAAVTGELARRPITRNEYAHPGGFEANRTAQEVAEIARTHAENAVRVARGEVL